MRMLRRLADEGRTVVLTIHQPSYSTFVLMDHILVLEEGGFVAYFGPTAIDSFDYYGVGDREPEALLERMDRKPDWTSPGKWAQRYAGSDLKRRLVDGRAASLAKAPPAPLPVPETGSFLRQLAALTTRSLRMKLRDAVFLALAVPVPALVAAMFVAVLNAEVQDSGTWSPQTARVEHNYLLVWTIMTCFFGALSACLEICTELPVLNRERRGGVGIVPYVLSKAIVYAIPAAVFPLVAVGTVMVLADGVVEGRFLDYWSVLAPCFFASACAGLLVSALLRTQEFVVLIAVAYAIVQIVLSIFAPLHITIGSSGDDHPVLALASAPTSARWTLAGLVGASDLCTSDDDTSGGVGAVALAAERLVFERQCPGDMYASHGVDKADTREGRVDSQHRHSAIIINLVLALLALVATGLVVGRRKLA